MQLPASGDAPIQPIRGARHSEQGAGGKVAARRMPGDKHHQHRNSGDAR